ncbi:FAM50/XAP5 family protein, partial [Staphylococcus aureus]|uniref:FAM50/XAP5 family protein n=1 Tax=Staphylococcus aureus TaxID=1280 RepID=UPI002020B4F6
MKKKKKVAKPGGLSFGDDEGDDEAVQTVDKRPIKKTLPATADQPEDDESASVSVPKKRGFKPNAAVDFVPRAMTKSALSREAQLKDALKKEYQQLQEAVKSTEFMIPFVFYDGKT